MTNPRDLDHAKHAVRQHVWDLLERDNAAPPGVHGHIPDFAGKKQAAARLAEHDQWKNARVIKCNPDRAQLPVRLRALHEGKLVYMAVPKLATAKPFYLLDPETLTVPFDIAATSTGAADVAPLVEPQEMRPVDLVVCGSVAISRHDGVRIGKGAGYSDLELALLTDAGLITENTTIATTVHDLQLIDDALPYDEHDFAVDLAITPTEALAFTPTRPRPAGILAGKLRPEQLRAIPVLAQATRHRDH
ncbi:5-formyltetrahydrofolate cyclo-ligase [Micromonospora sp. WMMC250]|uniref:5-formyltetrahydrofolate cyclo-ligase n=1 Tax=Micromonospora sp. WMMC250 TaxID=3014781 RepID=UPI0022B64E82|nr:5-formyltetrahydrofolate cyclo-ligase [Micromonospora sp. WMMC250]MCZ7376504.1 hypothetical protein [Micromonospora sp. WMMC250]